MKKLSLPATVKVAGVSLYVPAAATVYGVKLPVHMGKNEILVVLAARFVFEPTTSEHDMMILWGMWRKSEATWPHTTLSILNLAEEADIVASGGMVQASSVGATGISIGTITEDFVFPYPLVLIRAPQILFESPDNSEFPVGLWVYYLTQRVTDDELAALMVKDHA